MRPRKQNLGATLLIGPPALLALDTVLFPAEAHSRELGHWVTVAGLDTVTLLFGLAAILLLAAALGMLFATRTRRRRDRRGHEGRAQEESTDEVALVRWIEEGRQLFSLWQERVERREELESRLAATALEVDQLRAHVIYLSQQGEALLLERDHLRSVLARIGDLIQRASEVRPGAVAGDSRGPAVTARSGQGSVTIFAVFALAASAASLLIGRLRRHIRTRHGQ